MHFKDLLPEASQDTYIVRSHSGYYLTGKFPGWDKDIKKALEFKSEKDAGNFSFLKGIKIKDMKGRLKKDIIKKKDA